MVDLSVRAAAREFLQRGLQPLPVPFRKKAPSLSGWQSLRLSVDDIDAAFRGREQNIGILLGAASDGHVDIDVDLDVALEIAPAVLPETKLCHGRVTRRRSHHWYKVIGEHLPMTIRLRDPTDGATIVELRSTGCQTIAPPSQHPSGEALTWDRYGPAGEVAGGELLAAVKRPAATALLARHWPAQGGRQDAALAVGGLLLRGGAGPAIVQAIVRAATTAAGDDEVEKRVRAVIDTARALGDGRPTTGGPTAASLFPASVIDRVGDWLDLRRSSHLRGAPRPDYPLEPPRSATERLAEAVQRVPPLPAHARLSDEAHVAAELARSPWLDPFIRAAAVLTPRTPPSLLESLGLFLQSAAIARRAYLRFGRTKAYPVSATILVGRSTQRAKTTALTLGKDLLDAAGLSDLLLSPKFTEQALAADLALFVPASVREADERTQHRWLERHAHAAQRSLLRDEVSSLLTDFSKDWNSGLLPLVLELADAPDLLEPPLTLSRGPLETRHVGVNVLGATTPASLRVHIAQAHHWLKGLLARALLVGPDTPPRWAFWNPDASWPPAIIAGLRALYDATARPTAEYVRQEDPAGKRAPQVVGAVQQGYAAVQVDIASEALAACERYDMGMFDLVARPDSVERLDSVYGRLPGHALRFALSLAVTDWALREGERRVDLPVAELGHWAAGQAVIERRRHGLHEILAAALRGEAVESSRVDAAKLIELLHRVEGTITRGDALRMLHWEAARLDAAVEAAGDHVSETEHQTGGRPTILLELAPHTSPAAGTPDAPPEDSTVDEIEEGWL